MHERSRGSNTARKRAVKVLNDQLWACWQSSPQLLSAARGLADCVGQCACDACILLYRQVEMSSEVLYSCIQTSAQHSMPLRWWLNIVVVLRKLLLLARCWLASGCDTGPAAVVRYC
jgi:hypothetical protein